MTHLSYREDIDTMVVIIEGEMFLDTYRKALAALVQEKQFHTNMDTIWDLRNADLSGMSSNNIREGVTMASQSAEWRGTHWKTAVIVGDDLSFGLARMSEMLANGAPYRMGIFRTLEQAEKWIKDGPDEGEKV
jgi:hypothetical protein